MPSSNGLFSSHKFLFGVIFSRCKDSSALVRAKALQTMADVTATASENEVVADVIKNLFDPDRPNDNRYVRSPKNICRACLVQNSQYSTVGARKFKKVQAKYTREIK